MLQQIGLIARVASWTGVIHARAAMYVVQEHLALAATVESYRLR